MRSLTLAKKSSPAFTQVRNYWSRGLPWVGKGSLAVLELRALEAASSLWAALRRMVARDQWLVADQMLVSGMNFLTAAILAHMLGVSAFGVFSVYYVVLLYVNSIQAALILSPMMSLAPQILDRNAQGNYLRGMAGLQYSFALGNGCVVFFIGGLMTLHLIPSWAHFGVLFPFGVTIVFFQCQDWLRRFYYVHNNGKSVFLNDLISYGGQVLVLLLFYVKGVVSVQSAFWAIAITSLAAFLLGLAREEIMPAADDLKRALPNTWKLGSNLLVASQFQWLGSQGVLLVAAIVIGVGAASGIRAVITLLGPINIFLQLIENVIPVRAAGAYARGGRRELVQYLERTGLYLMMVLSIPIAAIVVFAKPIMNLAFGPAFAAFAGLVIWQALYYLLGVVYRELQYYHRTVGTARVLASTAVFASIATALCSVPLAKLFATAGILIALVIGQVVSVVVTLVSALRPGVEQKEA